LHYDAYRPDVHAANHGETFATNDALYAKMGAKDGLWRAQKDANPYATAPKLLLPNQCVVNGANGSSVCGGMSTPSSALFTSF